MRPIFVKLTALILTTVSSLAFAQPGVTIRTTTTLVQVNVVAHDAKGNPVAGLTKDDFEVFDSGRPQTIATFAAEHPAPAARRDLPANTFTNEAADAGQSHGGYTVILLDLLNIGDLGEQIWARQAVTKVITGLGSTEKVALYVLDRYGIRAIAEFGADRDLLMRRVAALNGHPSPYLQPDSQTSATVSAGQDLGAGQDQFLYAVTAPAPVFSQIQGFLANWTIQTTLDALGAIGEHLASVPPRKALIWVSYGVPQMVRTAPMAARTFPNAMPQIQTYGEDMDRAVRKLTNAEVAVYGVDAAGVWGGMKSPGGATLDEVASRTGGTALHGNGLDFEIQTALDEVDRSYTLGYYPPPDYDAGRFHRIKVEVKRPGVKLRYREGYSEDSQTVPSEDPKAKVVLALLSPVDDSSIPITVEAARTESGLSLQVTLQPASLSLVQTDGRWKGNIELIARFAAEDGTECETPSSETVEYNLTQQTYAAALNDGLTLEKALDIPPRASKLRLLVRDDSSGKLGTLSVPLRSIGDN